MMKIHDLASALERLAGVLRRIPNTELSGLEERVLAPPVMDSRRIALNLTTLAAMARVDRQQWKEFISEYSLPISIRPRDASRDILGKLLRYLEENPAARKLLRDRTEHRAASASPQLMKALNILLNDDDEGSP